MSRLTSYLRQHHLALLALFVALGGTSFAAVQVKAGSVGPKQIRNNSVTSSKVKDGSLLSKDFKAGQLPAGAQGAKGDAGVAGPRGAPCLPSDPACRGPRGATGDQGPGATALSYNTQENVVDTLLATVGQWQIWAQCDHQGGTNTLLSIEGPGSVDYQVTQGLVDDGTGGTIKTGSSTISPTSHFYLSDFIVNAGLGHFRRFAGTLMVHSGTSVLQVEIIEFADGRTTPGTCSAYGTAIPTT